MEKDHLVTHPSTLDKTYTPTFNEAARGQQPQQQEGSQQVEKDKPHPVLEPGNKKIRQAGAQLTHEQRMIDDHAQALGNNTGEGKQQSDERKPLREIFWKAKRRAHAMTPFQQAAHSPERNQREAGR